MKYVIFDNQKYQNISKQLKVSTLVAKAIEAYDLKTSKDIKLESPYKFNGMQELVSFLLKSINDKKKIVIYGDYDVDGICSVSILKRMFKLLNTDIGFYIPNRYTDGYGINCIKVDEIVNKKYDILICIDNGINAKEAINYAKAKGLEVIVLDHHELNGELPNCDYFLHPIISNFSNYNMCASSVAYYLSIALLGESDDKCAILSGIATLSDIMPLIEQNKILLKNAIDLLNKHKYKNMDMLIDNQEYSETSLSMTLIPKLNSIGRVIKSIKVNDVVKFLFEDDENMMTLYSKFILSCNEYRKKISAEFYEKINLKEINNIAIIKDDDLIEGVCGIVASRIMNTLNIPAIVFSLSEDKKYYKGSARSINGVNIVNLLKDINYIVSFGGHKNAAGLTIDKNDFDRFKHDVEEKMKSTEVIETQKKVILVEENELTYNSYLELLKYGPFGEGNPYPLFILKNIDKNKVTFSKDKKHLIIKINNDVTLLGFNLANIYQEKYNNYEAIFTIDKNSLIKNKLSCKCEEIIGGNS